MISPEDSAGHAAIVFNPVKVSRGRLQRAVEAQERLRGMRKSRWFATGREDSGRAAARAALESHPAVIIVAGGDGTLNAVVDVVHGCDVPLALVPFGTANLFARHLQLPLHDVEASVRTAFEPTAERVDVAVAELHDELGDRSLHTFMVMAGIGLDAEMAEGTSPKRKSRLGWFAYVRPIVASIFGNRMFDLSYSVNGTLGGSTRAHTVIVGNCGVLTANLLLIPDARVDDGLLDVVMFRPRNWNGWTQIGLRLTTQGLVHRLRVGRFLARLVPDQKALRYSQGRMFEAEFDKPRTIQIDGDVIGGIVRVRTTVRHGALLMVLPPGPRRVVPAD